MPTAITKYVSRSVRSLYSTHSTWANARSGSGLKISGGPFTSPNYFLPAGVTAGPAAFWLYRAMMHFPQIDLPAAEDREMLHAYLYVYIIDAGSGAAIHVTRGVHGEPIETSHWAADTAKIISGGSIAYADITAGAYNAILLNDTAIGWLDGDGAPDEEYEGYSAVGTTSFPIYHDTGTPKYARWTMSFTPDTTHTIKSIKMTMKRKGDAGTLTFDIRAADANHRPTGAVLATGTKAASTISATTFTWYEITLGAGVALTASSEYCIEVYSSAGDDTNNYVYLYGVSAGKYDGGQACFSDDQGSSYDYATYANYDIFFAEYGAGYLDGDGNPITKGTLLTLKGAPDISGAEPSSAYAGSIGFHSPRYGAGSRAPYLYFEYYKDTFPTADLTRVTAIRHIYRPGLFRMEVTLGDVQNAIDMIDTKVRTEVGAPSYGPDWLERLMKHIGQFRVVPKPTEAKPPPYPGYTPEVPEPTYPTYTPPVPQYTPEVPQPPISYPQFPSYYTPEVPQRPLVAPIRPSPLDIFKEKMWSFVKDPLTEIRETFGRIKWW